MGYNTEKITTSEQYQAIKLYINKANDVGIENENIIKLKALLTAYETNK